MKVLVAGFKGQNNSSRVILDKIQIENKLYLENNKKISCKQMENLLNESSFDYVFILGQKPKIKDKVCIELKAKSEDEILETNFNVNALKKIFSVCNLNYSISVKAGNSFCNNIYYFSLKYLKDKGRKDKCIFLHLPYLKNITNFEEVINLEKIYLELKNLE